MTRKPDFDLVAAHRYFAAHCFNTSWQVMGQAERTPEDDERLIALGHASFWHWTQRADGTPTNLSIAHWLLSRIYCVVKLPSQAHRYAQSCLRVSEQDGSEPLYLGYAHEALARAALLIRDLGSAKAAIGRAQALADQVKELDDKKLLVTDLDELRRKLEGE
jgi:hypothetical protein